MSWETLIVFYGSFHFCIVLCVQINIVNIFLLNRLKFSYSAKHIFGNNETGWLHIADLQYGPRLRI